MFRKILSTFSQNVRQAAFFSFKNNNRGLKEWSGRRDVTSFTSAVGVAAVVALHTMVAGAKNEH